MISFFCPFVFSCVMYCGILGRLQFAFCDPAPQITSTPPHGNTGRHALDARSANPMRLRAIVVGICSISSGPSSLKMKQAGDAHFPLALICVRARGRRPGLRAKMRGWWSKSIETHYYSASARPGHALHEPMPCSLRTFAGPAVAGGPAPTVHPTHQQPSYVASASSCRPPARRCDAP
jgi:hypothetical protein